MNNPLYIFLDEGGNFDFSVNGTKYFTLTSIAISNPALRDIGKFYTKTLRYLLQYVCWPPNLARYSNVVIITDRIPVNKTRKAVEKAIKETFSSMNNTGKPYRILHYDSKSSLALQAVDYINWAIYRKWNSGDVRSYNLIKHRIRSEFDIFERGDTYYY